MCELIRPVKCFICNRQMYYGDDMRHEPEVKIKDDRYCHLKCWEEAGEEPKTFTTEQLKAEIARREAEEAKKKKPRPIYTLSPGHSLYDLFKACKYYIDNLSVHNVSDNTLWETNIGKDALTCIYGEDVWKWINLHSV